MTDCSQEIKILEGQHLELHGLAGELIRFLEKPRPEVGTENGQTWANQMAEHLTQLHSKLTRHFHAEERSGCLQELAERFPRSARTVEATAREHDRILGDLRTVLGAVMVYSAGKEPENPRIRRWTLSILEQLRRHENEETELLQQLHYQDLGSGG